MQTLNGSEDGFCQVVKMSLKKSECHIGAERMGFIQFRGKRVDELSQWLAQCW